MSIQAEELRRYVADRPPESWREASTRTVVVGSGKGGSGASTIAALLGIGMAEAGRRTLLVDGDDAIGALHHLFGIPSASEALLRQEDPDSEIIWVADRLALLPGGSVRHRIASVRTTPVQRSAFYRRIMPMEGRRPAGSGGLTPNSTENGPDSGCRPPPGRAPSRAPGR